jgi:hypothetical protein
VFDIVAACPCLDEFIDSQEGQVVLQLRPLAFGCEGDPAATLCKRLNGDPAVAVLASWNWR